ncbi:DUF262 domain-containing protein [Flavobacterium johnsoniae]|uniref:GmrSD restriction endonucleases N-terminal domain-containing protein n=1 Tax=Flavobacterium johnsoniae (strain ATCC 17061 / DSM 2064 / JCM 8514 / BCRC 14874 / CCUG 350202 / NBRC 14942 / NCIMB 11054 / UW101) TaxID=376686 RepID=A5FGF9_FLAJ1|nr:DUF262 domain-containing protein [Flavobacterium johnsoniae]ABQ05717.1 protein of unknown function DUF262 [Flavobacterium johnsoniae UW101]OXE95301.1 hypothetical protein B0A63_24885 [Flavobacterium johnsoniae UW101]WQG81454.1 DUF262 domain-containing protein [Flavobacterium johnsoniae UW101]SHM04707.1 Protein of unknown function DUF262 [Flavobacterium johnsoniae]
MEEIKNDSLNNRISNTKESLKFIYQLEGLTFTIDKYQRGYRWGIREIHSLLNDIITFNSSKESFYCLQPLVLKKKEETIYELIDGQQRSTTIYLILKYLLNSDFFNLKYETRGNKDGVNRFLGQLNNYNILDFIEISEEQLDREISDYWKKNFINTYGITDSVDNFYFFKAYCIIKRWFCIAEERKEVVHRNLLYRTKVIWYTEKSTTDNATNTFINFNDGKINLDQAELIKGLYVLELNSISDATRKAYEENQFADEWNAIEHHLKIPSFWSFINSEKDNREIANKITLLLQLEKGKGKKTEDLFYTYREYEKAFNSDKKPEWRNLSSLYSQLEEWFNNRETYHLLGALVHLTNKSVHDIIVKYKEKSNKEELNNYLRQILVEEFFQDEKSFKSKYNPDEIKYGKYSVFQILLIYNIAVAQLTDKYYKFPFDLFKKVKLWNIEHIYAKNSKGFENLDDLNDWYNELQEITQDLELNAEYLKLWAEIDLSDLAKTNTVVKNIESQLLEIFDKDSISNLCLLDNLTNIRVGNKVFRKKREMVLGINNLIDDGAYIPLATKMVFQKAMTPSDKITMNYWNTMDREAYVEDIKNKIKQFLGVPL